MNLSKTKAKTSSEYTRRLNLALVFIDNHIDQVIRLEDLARVSHFSAFHFHRIFHAMLGETVNEYVTRKRMEKAVARLTRQPTLSITDIAELGGFSSSANFAKAFKQYFGISPSELRNAGRHENNVIVNSNIGKIFRKYGKAFDPRDLYSQFVTNAAVFAPDKLKEILMQVKVEEIKEKPVVTLSSPRGYELESVYDTWNRLIQWADGKGIENDWPTRFAMCHDNPAITPEEKCRYDASIVVDPDVSVAEPYRKSTIPGGKYAIAYFKDDASKINQFMTEFCSHWMCNSGYEPDDYPPIFNYLNDNTGKELVEMDIYIKVKELTAT
ncbi:MAG: GyrI-like domain-containing protein [Thioalkalispiraceae bacterium]